MVVESSKNNNQNDANDNIDRWICQDDGRKVGNTLHIYYVNMNTGKKSQFIPKDFQYEYWPDGTRIYYHLGKCIECKNKMGGPNIFSAQRGTLTIGYSICMKCIKDLIEMQGITKEKYDNDEDDLTFADYILQTMGDDVPKCYYIALIPEHINKEQQYKDQLERSKIAKFHLYSKKRVEVDRRRCYFMKERCSQEFDLPFGDYRSWYQTTEKVVLYYGEFDYKQKVHIPDGKGLLCYEPQNAWYFGSFEQGLKHSRPGEKGKFFRDGILYEGEFVSDRRHGYGKETYADTTFYEGQWALGKWHGMGVLTYLDGSKYEGQFRFGRRFNKGYMVDPKGKRRVIKPFDDVPDDNNLDLIERKVTYEDYLNNAYEQEASRSNTINPKSLMEISYTGLGLVIKNNKYLYDAALLGRKVPDFHKKSLAAHFMEEVEGLSPSVQQILPEIAWKPKTEMKIYNQRFNLEDGNTLAYFFGGCPFVQIELPMTNLQPSHVNLLAAMIRKPGSPLKHMDLAYNPIGNDGVAFLMSALLVNTSLKVLKLSACSLTLKCCTPVKKVIINNKTLESLDLSFNNLGHEGASLLADSLKINRTLKKLAVRSINMGKKGGKYFIDGLAENDRSLQELIVADNHLGDQTAEMLAARMKRTTISVLNNFRYKDVIERDKQVAKWAEIKKKKFEKYAKQKSEKDLLAAQEEKEDATTPENAETSETPVMAPAAAS